jgi:hypothetical protein
VAHRAPELRLYTGVGSRVTPARELALMTEFARLMAARGWTLRTGGADGADRAFMNGMLLWWPAPYELYLPWPDFNAQAPPTLTEPTQRALQIAEELLPWWGQLSDATRRLMGRNVHQVLGADCETPSRMLVCWTPYPTTDEARHGGTGMALRVARELAPETELINLRINAHWNRIAAWIDPGGQEFPLRDDYVRV